MLESTTTSINTQPINQATEVNANNINKQPVANTQNQNGKLTPCPCWLSYSLYAVPIPAGSGFFSYMLCGNPIASGVLSAACFIGCSIAHKAHTNIVNNPKNFIVNNKPQTQDEFISYKFYIKNSSESESESENENNLVLNQPASLHAKQPVPQLSDKPDN